MRPMIASGCKACAHNGISGAVLIWMPGVHLDKFPRGGQKHVGRHLGGGGGGGVHIY